MSIAAFHALNKPKREICRIKCPECFRMNRFPKEGIDGKTTVRCFKCRHTWTPEAALRKKDTFEMDVCLNKNVSGKPDTPRTTPGSKQELQKPQAMPPPQSQGMEQIIRGNFPVSQGSSS